MLPEYQYAVSSEYSRCYASLMVKWQTRNDERNPYNKLMRIAIRNNLSTLRKIKNAVH